MPFDVRSYQNSRNAAIRAGVWHPTYQRRKTPTATQSPSTADLAWAAGFLEGEGNFGTNRRELSASQVVRATQKNREPLYRLQTLFGGTVAAVRSDGFGEWRTYGARARGIMLTLFPFLSAWKRTDIKRALGGY